MARVKVKTMFLNIDEVNAAIEKIRANQQTIALAELVLNETVDNAKKQFEAEGKPLAEQNKMLVLGIENYADTHRDTLLKNGAKSTQLAAGTIGWRMGNPRVVIPGDVDDLIADLQLINRDDLLSYSVTLNKASILAHPESIENIAAISIAQKESFYVEPHDVALAAAA